MIPVIAYSTKRFPWMDVFAASAERGGVELIQLVNESGVHSDRCKGFARTYRHLSPNSVAFELTCFQRYFAISDYVAEKGYKSFFMSDTDILFNQAVGSDLSELTEGIDVMLSRPQRDSEASDLIEYSPHFSFWTKEAIDDFIDFVVNIYGSEEGLALIEQTYRSNKVIAPYSGVSDMTLCHLWLSANRPKFRNSVFTDNRITLDHNIAMSDHRFRNQFKKTNGIKSLDLVNGKLYFQGSNGELSYPLIMHFQGKYKIIMQDVLNKKLTWAYTKAALVSGVRIARGIKSLVLTQTSVPNG